MHFLPDVYVTCEQCKGARYNRETLEVKFKGKSIADVLDMTIEDSLEFFKAVPPIRDKMAMLAEVGLGYVKVGQSATTLSGGEAQRVKLAKELSRRATGQTLYILDEPTTGLHFEDVRKLMEVLHALVEHGNSVVVIEHNLDVIKTADWIIDLGPEGGVKGGEIVAEGTPEDVAKEPRSYTGHYLKGVLAKSVAVEAMPVAKGRKKKA
jgi:excinuclease ABC subunit A